MRDTSKYFIDGERWPSVTECLAAAGISDLEWMKLNRPAVLEAAAARGTEVHEWTELIDTGVLPDWELTGDPQVDARVQGYLNFLHDTGFEPLEVEVAGSNPYHRFAGTADRIGMMNGHLAVVDIKCVAALSPATGIQLAGYASMHAGVVHRWALRLIGPQTGGRGYTLNEYPIGDYQWACEVMHSAAAVAWWRHDHLGIDFDSL